MVGWWWLPRRLRDGKALLPCLLLGLALGLWSMGWWLEPDIALAEPLSVLIYNSCFGLLLLPAYVLWSRFDLNQFHPSRIEIIALLLLLALYFVFVTIATQPLALPVLPPLLVVILWALLKNRQRTLTIQFPLGAITFKQELPLLLIPITGSLIYTIALTIGLPYPRSKSCMR